MVKIARNAHALKLFIIAAALLGMLLGMAAVATADYTHGGKCDTACGSSVMCIGKSPGEACALGACDSACQCTSPITACSGTDSSKSKSCCESKGFNWLKSGEKKAAEAQQAAAVTVPAAPPSKSATATTCSFSDLTSTPLSITTLGDVVVTDTGTMKSSIVPAPSTPTTTATVGGVAYTTSLKEIPGGFGAWPVTEAKLTRQSDGKVYDIGSKAYEPSTGIGRINGVTPFAVGKKIYLVYSYWAGGGLKGSYSLSFFDTESEESSVLSFNTEGSVSVYKAGDYAYALWVERPPSYVQLVSAYAKSTAPAAEQANQFASTKEVLESYYTFGFGTVLFSAAEGADGNGIYITYGEPIGDASTGKYSIKHYDWSLGHSKLQCSSGSGAKPSITASIASLASKTDVDTQFKDSKGERKAAEDKRLGEKDEETCTASDWFARGRECANGACASNPSDAALCDKSSDCVFNGKCYSDIITVASTFFNNDLSAVWQSKEWQKEVAVDVNGDGKLEVCDPGQWQNPTGTVAGTVKDSTSLAPISGATVNMVGTPPNQGTTYSATTAADGTYTINNVNAGTYDMRASKAGYNDAVKANQPVQPFQTNTVDFQLTQAGGGGVWQGGVAAVSGTVTNIKHNPVSGATVKVLGTAFSATTAADGTYSIANIPSGTYDISSSKPSDGYTDSTANGVDLVSGTTTVDFTMLLGLGGCTNDCTKAGSNTCDASCDGKGSCKFYSDETKQACDGTFGIIGLTGGRQVSCCKGQPYTPQKADVRVQAKQIVKTVKPVLYQGKLVNLVMLLFIPEKSS